MTTLAQIDQSSTSGSASANKVTAAGNKQIAQIFVAGISGSLESVRVNVSYNGGGNARPRVSVRSVLNGAPSATVLGAVSMGSKDIGLSTDATFSTPIPQVAGMAYAIVVDYPNGRSNDTFTWTASGSSDATRPCFTGDGVTWNAQASVCDFMTYASNSGATGSLEPDSKGPVV